MSFFDYPTSGPETAPLTQVLLADASEADWTALLDYTQAMRFGAGQEVLHAGGGGRLPSTCSWRAPSRSSPRRGGSAASACAYGSKQAV